MSDLSREEFESWMYRLRDDIKGVQDRLDLINGRMRQAESDIAVLQDRGTRDPGARWSAGLVGLAGVVMEVLHRVWGAK